MWDGHKVSVRDRVNSSYNLTFHSTNDIIEYLQSNNLPNRIMFTFHPQRWNDGMVNWTKEYIMQNLKNIIKKAFYVNKK